MNAKAIIGGLAIIAGSAAGVYHFTDEPTEVTIKTDYFLAISDPHLHAGYSQKKVNATNKTAGDTGEDLWKIAMEKFSELMNGKGKFPKPKFAVLLGDLPWHANPDDENSLAGARASTKKVLSDLSAIARTAGVPLIYATGNNDSWGGDYRAFTTDNKTPFMLDSMSSWPVINSGACSLSGENACIADSSEIELGCYSVYPFGKSAGLKIISLNTVMFNHDDTNYHSWHYYGPVGEQKKDVVKQMAWLEKQFTEGDTSDKIILGMHIPPGIDGFQSNPPPVVKHELWDPNLQYKNKSVKEVFLNLVARHQNRIIGVLSGHTHLDGIRKMMYKDDNNGLKFSDLIISIPGIGPGHGNNPAMKMFSYDTSNFELMNFTTVYNNYHAIDSVSKTWGDSSFSFMEYYHSTPKISMRNRIAAMAPDSMLEATKKIYMAKGSSLGKPTNGYYNDVSLTVEVKP